MMKRDPLVSAVMAAYNAEDTITESIKSVLEQTYGNIELIIVNDCSTDQTAEIIRGFSDDRIRYTSLPSNSQICYARNVGLKQAKGDYIAIIDSDDIWERTKIEEQLHALHDNPECGTCITWADIIDENGSIINDKEEWLYHTFRPTNTKRQEWLLQFLKTGNCICNSSALISRETFDAVGLYRLSLLQLQDFDYWVRAVSVTNIFCIRKELTKYRRIQAGKESLSDVNDRTKTRTINEEMFIYTHFFDTMADDDFVTLFRDYFRDSNANTAVELKVEKAFLLKEYCHNSHVFYYYAKKLVDDLETVELLKEKYAYSVHDFYSMSAKPQYYDEDAIAALENSLTEERCKLAEYKKEVEKTQMEIKTELENKFESIKLSNQAMDEKLDRLLENDSQASVRAIDGKLDRLLETDSQISVLSDLLSEYRRDCQNLEKDNLESRKLAEENEAKRYAAEQENSELKKSIQGLSDCLRVEKEETEKFRNAYNETLSSTSWKITKPLRKLKDILRWIFRVNAAPNSNSSICAASASAEASVRMETAAPEVSTENEIVYVRAQDILTTENPIDGIDSIYVPDKVKRINLVTDTIDSGSLLGGVATALIIVTEFANIYDYELRIITRKTDVNPLNYQNIIEINGLKYPDKVSFYSDFDRKIRSQDFKLELSEDDIFVATSWWSAKAIENTTRRKRFFYVIQEVETFFYNYGSERLVCEQVMKNKNIDFIINSHYLFDYFQKNEKNITDNGFYFEPAFSETLYSRRDFSEKSGAKLRLFFYSRPNNPRNLFAVGIQLLDQAITAGVLDSSEWEICFVGQDAPPVEFSDGSRSVNMGRLSWSEYAEFLQTVDLGLCLMYTPHPSYPPYDVACSGGVVLTNMMLNKTSFDGCENVILADIENQESALNSFKTAIQLAKDTEKREENYNSSRINRNWNETLKSTMKFMEGRI